MDSVKTDVNGNKGLFSTFLMLKITERPYYTNWLFNTKHLVCKSCFDFRALILGRPFRRAPHRVRIS